MPKLPVTGVVAFAIGVLLTACSASRNNSAEPVPVVRIGLSQHGLPKDFFQADADTKCSHQIIGYRFVVWLDNQTVAVGFNTSPNCRPSPDQKVHGVARILVFDAQGRFKASRDLPYDADGGKVLVAPGEGRAGPGGTILFRIEEAGDSKSGILLLDANLRDTARLDRFLEQTTFVDHALVFQEGVVWSGPRTYDTFDGFPLVQTRQKEELWPVGTMDRKFGEHGVAYMLCQQELRPNEWVSDNVVYANARRRCRMVSEPDGQASWEVPLKDEGTAVIVGILADSSVVGQVPVKGRKDRQLVIFKKDGQTVTLPWIAAKHCGAVDSATSDMSRYATFAAEDCDSDFGRWMVFDRTSQTPIADRLFPRNGRAALSPDGLRYASFEAGELRIYTLPSPLGAKTPVMVSNSVVTRIRVRWPIHASFAAGIFTVLYRYWLVTPVLQYMSVGRWRLFAVVVAAACGGVLSLLRVSTPALSVGAMFGLLLGGTWAAWKFPNDVAISVYGAFASHLESFWRETLMLTFTTTLAGFCCAYIAKRSAGVQ